VATRDRRQMPRMGRMRARTSRAKRKKKASFQKSLNSKHYSFFSSSSKKSISPNPHFPSHSRRRPPPLKSLVIAMRALVLTSSSSLVSCSGGRQMAAGVLSGTAGPATAKQPMLSTFAASRRRSHSRRSRSHSRSSNLLLRPLFAFLRSDEVLRTLSEASEISVLAVDGTRLVAEATRRHGTAPTASAALGRALLGGLLMSAFKGEGEATQITFKGTGPLGGLQVVAEATGAVKGRVDNPSADPPLRRDGKLDVGAAIGGGVLAIVRSREGGSEPYTGLTQIVSGEIADDLAHYLATSEQVRKELEM
jgi:hypothetical protein